MEGTITEKEFQTMDYFENGIVSKNGSIYIIQEQADQVAFGCEAEFPVIWKATNPSELMYFSLEMVSTERLRISNFDEKNLEPTPGRFYNFLILAQKKTVSTLSVPQEVASFLNAGFTCESLDKETKESQLKNSIHVYFNGTEKLEREGSKITIQLEPKSSQQSELEVVLPCRPSLPQVLVNLEKENGNWSLVTNAIQFNPNIGFTLKGNDLVGEYKCSVPSTNDTKIHQVFISVITSESDNSTINFERFQPQMELRNGASIETFGSARSGLSCCSASSDDASLLPAAKMIPCRDPLKCELFKAIYPSRLLKQETENDRNCSKTKLPLSMGTPHLLASCYGPGIKFEEEYIALFSPESDWTRKNGTGVWTSVDSQMPLRVCN